MNVLQIANDYLNPIFFKMFNGLKKIGILSRVVVPISKDAKIGNGWGKEIIVLRCFSAIDRMFFFRKQKKIINKIKYNVDFSDISVIHAHTLFSNGYSAMMLHRKYNIPYIVAIRNTDVNVFLKWMPWLRKIGINIMREASTIVFISPAYKKHVIEKYIPENEKHKMLDKSVVIPNGISEVFLENKGKIRDCNRKKISILYVGEITKNKNIGVIVKVGHFLKARGDNVEINIVGDLVDYKCKKYLNDSIVCYSPRCNQEDLISIYRSADIFLMPSHTETFGLVYAEAMSQGLPVLYTRGQGFDQYFEDGVVGFGVDENSVTDICNKIDLVFKNYKCISSNCIAYSERFDWNKIAKEYRCIYENAIGNNDA